MGKQQETQPKTDRQTCQDKGTHTNRHTFEQANRWMEGWAG